MSVGIALWLSRVCPKKPITIELIQDLHCECWDNLLVINSQSCSEKPLTMALLNDLRGECWCGVLVVGLVPKSHR